MDSATPKKKLFALLVGIGKYPSEAKLKPLDGAIKDINFFRKFLLNTYNSYDLKIKILANKRATYQNIIDFFGELHLLKAQKDDIVLFYFAGHGSREKAATEFLSYFPSGLNETLICYDSRPEGLDLADKELAVLFHRIHNKGSHIVSILDCCHSGSGVRDSIPSTFSYSRQGTERRTTPRSYSSYLSGYYEENYPHGENLIIPTSKMLSIGACNLHEKAYELKIARGFFSYTLLNILEQNQRITYAELYQKCKSNMRRITRIQSPQFEPYRGFYPNDMFLLAYPAKHHKYYSINYQPKTKGDQTVDILDGWRVNFGEIDAGSYNPSVKPTFELFDDSTYLGTANILDLGFQHSWMDESQELIKTLDKDRKEGYKARLCSFVHPDFAVELQHSKDGETRLGSVLKRGVSPKSFQFSNDPHSSNYLLSIDNYQIQLIRKKPEREILLTALEAEDDILFREAFRYCNSIAQWHNLWELQNRFTGFHTREVEIILHTYGEKEKRQVDPNRLELVLPSKGMHNLSPSIDFSVEVHNHWEEDLFCSLFYFSPDYDIHFKKEWYHKIPARKRIIFIPRSPDFSFSIKPGKLESIDRLKFFVSPTPIEGYRYIQPLLETGKEFNGKLRNSKQISRPKQKLEYFRSDWFTRRIAIEIKR